MCLPASLVRNDYREVVGRSHDLFPLWKAYEAVMKKLFLRDPSSYERCLYTARWENPGVVWIVPPFVNHEAATQGISRSELVRYAGAQGSPINGVKFQ
jgi:hypothetical protein